MSPEKAIHADHAAPPNINRMAGSTKGHGMRVNLEAPLIGLATYLVSVSLGLSEDFASGVLITASFTSAARLMNSEFSQKESIIRNASLGLFAQLVCYHFEMNPMIRIGNALSTGFSVYLASGHNPSCTKYSAEKSRVISGDDLDSPAADSSNRGESKRTGIWLVFAGLILFTMLAIYLSTNQPAANNCLVSARKIDSTHWQAVIRGGYLSHKGCDLPAQLSLAADEIKVYTRDLKEEACGVSCIKQNHAGYWTAYVSIIPLGSPVDATYCDEAYSFGECGQRLFRSIVTLSSSSV